MAQGKDGHIGEKIGTAVTKGRQVEIRYAGGSMFTLTFVGTGSAPSRIEKKNIDSLIAQRKIRLESPHVYDEICAAIGPDGSTKTHNADGTPKSRVSRTISQLMDEGYVHGAADRPKGGQLAAAEGHGRGLRKDKETPSQNRPSPFESSHDEMPDSEYDEPAFVDDDEDEKPRRPQGRSRGHRDEDLEEEIGGKVPEKTRAATPGDLNGDGIIDEMDGFVAEERKKNPVVIGALLLSVLASFGLFVAAFVVTSGITGKTGTVSVSSFTSTITNLLPKSDDGAQQGGDVNANTGGDQVPSNEQATNDGNDNSQTSGEQTTVVRTDYDPEDAVASFELASESSEKIAIAMFQAIRTDILNGDVNAFTQAVDIERIAGEIAPAYASYATETQGLSAAERTELETSYKQTFSLNERQHVVDKDPYASIFGGRIREVRQDPVNKECIYVVTESIAGDHQRACFALNGNDTDGWTVTDIVGVEGYVKMIAEGSSLLG